MWTRQSILFLQYYQRVNQIIREANKPINVENFQNSQFVASSISQIYQLLDKYYFLLNNIHNHEIFSYENLISVTHRDYFISEHFLKLNNYFKYFLDLDMDKAQEVINLILSFKVNDAISLIEDGAQCDYQDPRTGATAMHIAASFGTRRLCEVISESETYNPLLMDFNRKLPSTVAFDSARDAELSEWLSAFESERAKQLGLSYFKILQGGLDPAPGV